VFKLFRLGWHFHSTLNFDCNPSNVFVCLTDHGALYDAICPSYSLQPRVVLKTSGYSFFLVCEPPGLVRGRLHEAGWPG